MSDFLGRPLKHNDLVVSKPGGRHAYMRTGIIRDEYAGVWFGRGSHGGSDIVWIDTEKWPDLEEKRLTMVADREQEILDKAQEKIDKAKKRIKKKDFKRFGVYSEKSNSSAEIYLGTCMINSISIDNVWMHVGYVPYDEKRTKGNTEIDFWRRSGWSYDKFRPQKYRTVKYPQKFIEDFVLTGQEFNDKIAESLCRLMEHKDWNSYSKKTDYFIKIV